MSTEAKSVTDLERDNDEIRIGADDWAKYLERTIIFQGEIVRLRIENSALKENCDLLRKQAEAMSKDAKSVNDLEREIVQLKIDNRVLNEQYELLLKDVQAAHQRMASRCEHYNKAIEKWDAALKEQLNENSKLRKETECDASLKEEMLLQIYSWKKKAQEQGNISDALSALEKQYNDLSKSHADVNAELVTLREQYAELAKERDLLREANITSEADWVRTLGQEERWRREVCKVNDELQKKIERLKASRFDDIQNTIEKLKMFWTQSSPMGDSK